MELKSGNEQAKFILDECNSLIARMKNKILCKNDPTQGLDQNEITDLLRTIINPMNNLGINGNEALLEDLLNISDYVVKTLDNALHRDDEENLSDVERKAIKTIKKRIEAKKEERLDPIDTVYKRILDDFENDRLVSRFVDRETNLDEEVQKLTMRINKIGSKEDINRKIVENNSIMSKISPEVQEIAALSEANDNCESYSARIEKIKNNLSKPNISDKDKAEMKGEIKEFLQKGIKAILKSSPEFQKEKYKQKEGEGLEEYSDRLAKDFNDRKDKVQQSFGDKLIILGDVNFTIAEDDPKSQTYKISTTTIDLMFGDDITNHLSDFSALGDFAKDFIKSTKNLKIAAVLRDDLESDIEEKRRKISDKLNEEIDLQIQEESTSNNSPAVVTAYSKPEEELTEGQKKWQRFWFKVRHPSLIGKDVTTTEAAMTQKRTEKMQKNAPQTQQQDNNSQNNEAIISLSKRELLKNIETQQRNGRDIRQAYEVRARVEDDIFDKWSKNRKAKEDKRKEESVKTAEGQNEPNRDDEGR